MTIMELGAIGEFIGAFAVVATLIYLAIQMRQNTNALKLISARSITEELQETFSLLATNQELAEILVKASGESALHGAEAVRYYTLTSNLVRVYENAFLQSRAGAMEQAQWEGLTRLMIDYTSMAAFQQYWQDRKHWVSEDFQEYMESEVVSAPLKAGVNVPGGY